MSIVTEDADEMDIYAGYVELGDHYSDEDMDEDARKRALSRWLRRLLSFRFAMPASTGLPIVAPTLDVDPPAHESKAPTKDGKRAARSLLGRSSTGTRG